MIYVRVYLVIRGHLDFNRLCEGDGRLCLIKDFDWRTVKTCVRTVLSTIPSDISGRLGNVEYYSHRQTLDLLCPSLVNFGLGLSN